MRTTGDNMQKVHIKYDESSHQYLVPDEAIKEWDDLENKISSFAEYSDEWYVAIDNFEKAMGKYRRENLPDLYILPSTT